ncbi:unnamed protein product, partial [Rotaria sp. Silwood2]
MITFFLHLLWLWLIQLQEAE